MSIAIARVFVIFGVASERTGYLQLNIARFLFSGIVSIVIFVDIRTVTMLISLI